jgi:hypothetical protein
MEGKVPFSPGLHRIYSGQVGRPAQQLPKAQRWNWRFNKADWLVALKP